MGEYPHGKEAATHVLDSTADLPAPTLGRRSLRLGLWALGVSLVALMLGSALVLLSPRAFGVIVVQGRGSSMLPTLRDGDIVLVEIAGPSEVRPGEIILFEAGGHSVLHRVIEKSTAPDGHAFLVTRGDNNDSADPVVDGSQVRGKMLLEVPLTGTLSRSLGTPNVLMGYRYVLVLGSLAGLALTVRRLSRVRQGASSPSFPRSLTPDS